MPGQPSSPLMAAQMPPTPPTAMSWWRTPVFLVIAAFVLFGGGGMIGFGAGLFTTGFVDGFTEGVAGDDFADYDTTTYGIGGDLEAFVLEPGACAATDLMSRRSFEADDAIDCRDEHAIEVFSVIRPPVQAAERGRPDEVDVASYGDSACYLEFEPYVGATYEDSELDFIAVIPTAAAWTAGAREVFCVLFHLDGYPLQETARNSGR